MRDDILSGRLHPGERLMFPDLCSSYSASVGAIREALVSLVGQGLVKTQAHQGYIVTPLSSEDLMGLTSARLLIEPIILREAVRDGGLEWEGRVVTTHHVLSRTPREDGDDHRFNEQWAAAHQAFHEALFSGASNRRLIAIVGAFAEEAALYRRWSVPLEVQRDVAAEHLGIMEATLNRDADLAAERLCEHISYTTRLLLEYSREVTAGSGT